MTIITNDRFEKGDTIVAADLNTKFTGVTTVTTGGLAGVNLRNEAVDLPNLAYVDTGGESGIILRRIEIGDNGLTPTTGVSYLNTANVTETELAGGAGSRISFGLGYTLVDGDLLRYMWALLAPEFNGAQGVGGGYSPMAWIVRPQWDITDPTLTNWEELPGQGDFQTAFLAGATAAHGTSITTTRALMVIPHSTIYMSPAGGPGLGEFYYTGFSARRNYTYLHSGANLNVYGIRLVIDGTYYLQGKRGANPIGDYIYHVNADPLAGDYQITVAGISSVALIMRST